MKLGLVLGMEITEKKEAESKGLNPQSVTEATSFNSDKEAEDRERQARDLKAGLHPLKVWSLSFSITPHARIFAVKRLRVYDYLAVCFVLFGVFFNFC